MRIYNSEKSLVDTVMADVAENYVSSKEGIAPYTRRVIDYFTEEDSPSDANIDVRQNGGLLVFGNQGAISTNKPPKNGHIIHFPGGYESGNWQTQLAISDNKKFPFAFMRAKDSGEWGDWQYLWTSGNFYKATGVVDSQALTETVPLGRFADMGTSAKRWVKLCHIKFKVHHQGNMVWFRIILGYGNNGTTTQIAFADLFLQAGWTGSANGRLGGNYVYYPLSTSYPSLTIKVISTKAGTAPELEYDVWVLENSNYCAKAFTVFTDGRYIDSITYDGVTQTDEPTGTACSIQGGRIAYTTF